VAPPTGVRGLASLLGICDLVLSGDCGPMHLAAALGVPCVAIFRVDDAWRYGPAGEGHRVMDDTTGRLDPAEVVAAVTARLADQRVTR
jgi:ADP-heptose:LPS heptosyltransferase